MNISAGFQALLLGYFVTLLAGTSVVAQTFKYPATAKHPVTDTLFGKVVIDEYRWLENLGSQQVDDWLAQQTAYTQGWMDKLPGGKILMEEYKQLDALTSASISPAIVREGGRYFYSKTQKGENVAKLYYKFGKAGKEILLFDPARNATSQSAERTFRFLPSKDGKKVAIALTESGQLDIYTVKILNVDTKTFYPDSLFPVNSLQTWSPDNKGFLYGSLKTHDPHAVDLFQDISIKYHQAGTAAVTDKVILSRLQYPQLPISPSGLLQVTLSPDKQYLVASIAENFTGYGNFFYAGVTDLAGKSLSWKPLFTAKDSAGSVLIYKEHVYFTSFKKAPNGQVLMQPLHTLPAAPAKVLFPESSMHMEWLKLSKDYLFVVKSDGIRTLTQQYHLWNGKTDTIQPPYTGNAWLHTLDATSNECIINVLSWAQPLTRFDYDPVSRKMEASSFNSSIGYPGTDDLVVEEVEVESHDGVKVPLSLIYNKNIKRDGKNLAYMTGYGAYGAYRIPFFDLHYLPLLNRGVVVAITHVRGGGEKGEHWHKGGYKATKANTWKDFIACGEYLISRGYTSARHLIGEGFSAGGILIGRAMTERPDLFAATIHNVPLSNPLRGENRPNGLMDAQEFGTVKDSTEAMGLLHMDTYHQVKPGTTYPAVLAVAGIHDTRVPVWQPAKLIAALQQAAVPDKPMLLLVNYDSGHLSEEKFVTFRNLATIFSFALWQAGHADFQPPKR